MASAFDARQRAVLDTNVIGDLLDARRAALRDEYVHMATRGISFHVNSYVLDELCVAIVSGALRATNVAELFGRLLDGDFPLLPYQTHLYGLAGFGRTPLSAAIEHVRAQRATYDAWLDLMASDPTWDEAAKLKVTNQVEEQWNRARSQYADTLALPDSQRRTADEADIPRLLEEEAVPASARRFDEAHPSEAGPPASVRCDGLIRSHSLLALRQWCGGKPASLKSKSQRGTMYDQCMLSCLALPAYLVTSDDALGTRVRDAGSYQAAWIMSPLDFSRAWSEGRIRPLEFPLAAS